MALIPSVWFPSTATREETHSAIRDELFGKLERFGELDERQQMILRQRYLEPKPMSLRKLSRLWRVSPGRIWQIELQAIRKLRPMAEWERSAVENCSVCGRRHYSDAAASQCDRKWMRQKVSADVAACRKCRIVEATRYELAWKLCVNHSQAAEPATLETEAPGSATRLVPNAADSGQFKER